ncbi:MAG: zinc ABC transporter substrate-binding protein [Treponema sp.]|nr:zinc ABC transporter substrate-binding protein [Treponema sp.]
MNFSKHILIFSVLSFLIFLNISVLSCSKSNVNKSTKFSIVCTTFPQYDWVKNITAGNEDKFEIYLLMNKGSDLHNYQPTAQDMIKIASSDLFIHVGGISDIWVKDALKESKTNIIVLNLVDILGNKLKIAKHIEGIQETEHHDDECPATCHACCQEKCHTDCHADCEEHHHEHLHNHNDEHVWLSLRNAEIFISKITDSISILDKTNANQYKTNAENYNNMLKELDLSYKTVVETAKRKTILFGDRFPFRYFVDDYGLTYFAAFSGCSAESEASFETIAFLAKKVSALSLPVVFVLEKSDTKIAQSIIANTENKNAKILVLNSMQSITAKDIESGANYLDIMKKNLDALKTALN